MNETPNSYQTKGGNPHMEQDSTQPIKSRHEKLTAEQEVHARAHIETALSKLSVENPLVSTETARVIAAALHQGRGTILEHFAATGRLNPEVALDELGQLVGTDIDQTWLDALRWHLDEIVRPWPDRRPPNFNEPAPEVFVSSPEGTRGQWITLVDEWRDIAAQLSEIDPAWLDRTALDVQTRGDLWTFGNAVGLHGLDLTQSRNLSQAIRIAKGVDRYGEGFAAYVRSYGMFGASRLRYLHLHVGSFDNMTELVDAYAYSRGMQWPDASPKAARVRGPTLTPQRLERDVRKHFLLVEGRAQIHMFQRPYQPDN
jgi:hypothetical protein